MDCDPPLRPAIPADALALLPPGQIGPTPEDWRIVALAVTGASGEPGWVAVRVHPWTVLPLVDDQATAIMLANCTPRVWAAGCGCWTKTGGRAPARA